MQIPQSSFLSIFLRQLIAFRKLPLQAVHFRPPRFFDSLLQYHVNVNFNSLKMYSSLSKRLFLANLQQSGFYIRRSIVSISELVATLEVYERQRVGKKAC